VKKKFRGDEKDREKRKKPGAQGGINHRAGFINPPGRPDIITNMATSGGELSHRRGATPESAAQNSLHILLLVSNSAADSRVTRAIGRNSIRDRSSVL
jgi:hypothetical protein